MSKKLIYGILLFKICIKISKIYRRIYCLSLLIVFFFNVYILYKMIMKQFLFYIGELSVQKLLCINNLRLLSVSLVVAAKWNAHPCERWHLSQMLLLTHLVPSEQTSFCCWWWWVHLCWCVYFVWCALLSCLAGCSRESICLAWNPSASQQRSRLHSFPNTLRHIIHLTHTLLREDSKPL
jgi:hypothetical protein